MMPPSHAGRQVWLVWTVANAVSSSWSYWPPSPALSIEASRSDSHRPDSDRKPGKHYPKNIAESAASVYIQDQVVMAPGQPTAN